MALRVGMLTSGGDCQGLNSTMRGVARSLFHSDKNVELIGFLDGYYGLMHCNYRELKEEDFSGILTLGGTILGTSRQPFKQMKEPLDDQVKKSPSKLEAMLQTYKDMRLDALVVLGGNGSQKTADLLRQNGCNVVSCPKTIDNDLAGTEMTFGFDSALTLGTEVIDAIHTTATSHGRVFIIELMGHKAGWLALYAGLAGGADVILIPEIPYDALKVLKALKKRREEKKRFSIIVIAEGAVTVEEAELSSKQLAEKRKKEGFRSVAYSLADRLSELMVQEIRCVVPGHFLRGGQPTATDRVLSTQLGAEAAQMILDKDFGKMAAVINGRIDRVPLEDVANKLKRVPKDHQMVKTARAMGVYFGD